MFVERHYEAYISNRSRENELGLCEVVYSHMIQTVYSHMNPDERAFMREYRKFLKKKDVHELLDQLIRSIT